MLRRCWVLRKADPWTTLGVTRGATEKEVKDAYLKLAKKYHPDVNKGGEEQFKAVKEAYESISSGDWKKQETSQRGGGTAGGASNYQRAYSYRRQNPFTDANYHGDPRFAGRAWSQRAEYYRVHQEEVEQREKTRKELQVVMRMMMLLVMVVFVIPLINILYASDEQERRKRQEEFDRLRRQHTQMNQMRGMYEDPSRPPLPLTGPNTDPNGYGWVWVHPYGWQWLPINKLPKAEPNPYTTPRPPGTAPPEPSPNFRRMVPPAPTLAEYTEEAKPNHPDGG